MQVRRAYPESEPRPIVLTDEQRAAIRETLQTAHDALVAGLDAQGAARGAIGQALAASNAFESTNGTLREKGHGRELWRVRDELAAPLRLLGDGGDVSLLE